MKSWVRLDDLFSAQRTVWWIHGAGTLTLVFALLGTEFALVMPYRQATQAEQERIIHLESLLARGESIRADFNGRKQKLDQKRANQQSLRERVPTEPMEAAFLAQLAGLARSVQLDVKDYRPGTITPFGDYSELKVEIQAVGSYPSIIQFLDQLPQLPRISSFTGLEISAEPEQSNYPIRLNFSTYFVPMNTDSRRAGTG